jgi:hypothetical protein
MIMQGPMSVGHEGTVGDLASQEPGVMVVTLHALAPGAVTLARANRPASATVLDIFRRLAEFRAEYDEAVLFSLATVLRHLMPESAADKVMSDGLTMDNEIRFRLPAGLSLREPGELGASTDEADLLALVRHSADMDDRLAGEAAERLGIVHHRILRSCARVLERSLKQGGVEIEWEAAPRVLPGAAAASSSVEMCR